MNIGSVPLTDRSINEFIKFNSNITNINIEKCNNEYQKCVIQISKFINYSNILVLNSTGTGTGTDTICNTLDLINSITSLWKGTNDPLIVEAISSIMHGCGTDNGTGTVSDTYMSLDTDIHIKLIIKFLLLTVFGWSIVCLPTSTTNIVTTTTGTTGTGSTGLTQSQSQSRSRVVPHIYCSSCNRSSSLSAAMGDLTSQDMNKIQFNMVTEHKSYCPCVYILQDKEVTTDISSTNSNLSSIYPGFMLNMLAIIEQLQLNKYIDPISDTNMSEEFDRIRKILE